MGEKALPTTPHQRQKSFGNQSQSPAADQGTATIAVVSAAGFKEDSRLEVRIIHDSPKGVKEVFRTKAMKTKTGETTYEEEPKKVSCNADHAFRVIVKDAHTFNSEDLGEASFFVNDQASGGTKEVKVGSGSVTVRSSFQPMDAASIRPGSQMGSESPSSKHHALGRFMTRKERSVTPSG